MFTPVSGTDFSAWSGQSSSDSQPPQTLQSKSIPRIPPIEATQLINGNENGQGYPDDSTNAKALADLQEDGLRGMPQDAIKFETQQTLNRQKIEALSQKDRDLYSRRQAEGINMYESATSASDRQRIAQAMANDMDKPLNALYAKCMADSAQRIRLEFTSPFGAQYLGSAGQQQSALLEHLGTQFDQARTPEERASLFRQAAGIRHDMQLQIQARTSQGRTQTDQQWAEADNELFAARDYAKSLQIATLGDFDNMSPFERLTAFAQKAFTSQRNVQEFQYLAQQHPESFKDVKNWYEDASAKTEQARSTIHSDPFRRTPNLPPPLADFTDTKTDDLHVGNYGPELLDRYQQMNRGVLEDGKMYHAASQGGPIKAEYLDAHTPPKPVWQQQTEDVLGRFFVGLIPGVNLFTNQIVPAKSLSQDARDGIDFLSGISGGMLGEAKIPGGKLFGKGESGEPGVRGSNRSEVETRDGNSSGDASGDKAGVPEGKAGAASGLNTGNTGAQPPANTSSSIPQVPSTYTSKPYEVITPDPQFRGIYRDSKGNAYIQQGDQTFSVSYQKDNETWAVKPPHGGTAPPYPVRLDNNGNWELNSDTGLPGGAGTEKYTDALGRDVYESYCTGASYKEIASQIGVKDKTVKNWATRYAKDHDLLPPYEVNPKTGARWQSYHVGAYIYTDLSKGASLQDAANKYTGGNTFAAYRSAVRYARTSGFPVEPVTHVRPAELGPAAGTTPQPQGAPSTSLQPQVEPMTRQQYEQTQQLDDQGALQPGQIAKQTGVPEPWVKDVEKGDGYFSPSKQAYIEPTDAPGSLGTEPPAKKARMEGDTATDAGPAPAAPAWGRNELRRYLNDPLQLDDATFDSINAWLSGNGPAPAGLQQQMIHDGYPNLTPDQVHAYLDAHSPIPLNTQQRIMISEWLGL